MTTPEGQGGAQVIYVKEKAHWGRRIAVFLGIIALAVAVLLGLTALSIIPKFSNPFHTQKTDRSGPVLVQSMQDLSRYVAAEGTFSVLVDEQEDNSWVPDFLYNDRTLFVGYGSVDAYVDFSQLKDGAIVVSPDGQEVTITLPDPVLDTPSLDVDKSYVYANQQGVWNHITNAFNNDPNKSQELYQLATEKIGQTAQDSGLIDRAKTNTETMLNGMLHQLGFQRVNIVWQSV